METGTLFSNVLHYRTKDARVYELTTRMLSPQHSYSCPPDRTSESDATSSRGPSSPRKFLHR